MMHRAPHWLVLALALALGIPLALSPRVSLGDDPPPSAAPPDAPTPAAPLPPDDPLHGLMDSLLRGTRAGPAEPPASYRALELPKSRGAPLPVPAAIFPEGAWLLEEMAPVPGLSTLSAKECGACHVGTHAQWASSGHAGAWTSPLYRAALKAAGSPPACIQCHTPLREQQPQVVTGFVQRDPMRPRVEPNPRFDPVLQQEGVTCAACHVRGGMIYGSRNLPAGRAPHPVAAHPDLKRSELCGACHQMAFSGAEADPFYDTLGEWRRSKAGKAGTTCADCHMPYVGGNVTAGGQRTPSPMRSHAVGRSGPEGWAALADAITVDVKPDKGVYSPGEEAVIALRLINTGAGHAIPTTVPFREITARLFLPTAKSPSLEPVLRLTREMSPTFPFYEVDDRRLQADGVVEARVRLKIPADAPSGPLPLRLELTYQAVPGETALDLPGHGLTQATILSQTLELMVR